MSKKSKATVRLEEGESYVVADIEFWDHIVFTYRTLSERLESPEKEAWAAGAEYIEAWAYENLNLGEEVEEEGWQ